MTQRVYNEARPSSRQDCAIKSRRFGISDFFCNFAGYYARAYDAGTYKGE